MSNWTVGPFTPAYLKTMISYDKETGIFTWKKTVLLSGIVAGYPIHVAPDGRVKVRGHTISARRLAWVLHFGEWPRGVVRSKTKNLAEARIAKLFMMMRAEVLHTRKPHENSILPGVRGSRGKYAATIQVEKKFKFLGVHETPEEAHRIYVKIKRTAIADLKKKRIYPDVSNE